MAEAGLPEPTIKKDDFMTIATLKNTGVIQNVGKNVGQDIELKINNLIHNNKITKKQIVLSIGVSKKL